MDWRLAARYSPALLAGGHTSIPDDAYRCYVRLSVTTAEWTLIGHLCSYRWSTADPFPSDATLAARMGVTVRSIQGYTRSLVGKGLLHINTRLSDNGRQDTNAYDLSPFFAAVEGLARLDHTTPKEPATPSGTESSLCVEGDARGFGGGVKNPAPPIKDEIDTIEKERLDFEMPPTPANACAEDAPEDVPCSKPRAPRPPRLVGKRGEPTAPETRVSAAAPATPEGDQLAARVAAIGERLGDEAPASSMTRARALYAGSGLALPRFLAAVGEAAGRTQARQDRITRMQRGGVRANAMPYLFAVLADVLDPAPPPETRVSADRRPPRSRRRQVPTRPPTASFSPDVTPAPITEEDPTWRGVLFELAAVLTPENFNRWFARTRVLSHQGDQLRVTVPDPFDKAWLEGKLAGRVTAALARTEEPAARVEYVVEGAA